MTSQNSAAAQEPEKSGLLGRIGSGLLGVFVEHDEPTPPLAAPVSLSKSTGTYPATPGVLIDQKMVLDLREVAMTRNTPFKTLVEASQRMATIIPDERTRLKAAFATISGDGTRTAASITDAIILHINDVETERRNFKIRSDQQRAATCAAPAAQADSISKEIESKRQQILQARDSIAKLEQGIGADQTQEAELRSTAIAAEQKITQVETAFNGAVDIVVGELKQRQADLVSVLK